MHDPLDSRFANRPHKKYAMRHLRISHIRVIPLLLSMEEQDTMTMRKKPSICLIENTFWKHIQEVTRIYHMKFSQIVVWT